MRRINYYIHQHDKWPLFKWDTETFTQLLGAIRNRQGRLTGYMHSLGFSLQAEAALATVTADVLKSSEIEGEFLDPGQVRSSVARRLGMDIAGLVPSDRNVDGVVEMMMDATQNFSKPLTKSRLFSWHASLFPTGRSGMHKISVGKWRNDSDGPMQVVSGAMGKEKIHFQAPDSKLLEKEMKRFLEWFNNENNLDPVLKAAVAHLWFITIHPFADGNGRIARAIADMQLCRADAHAERFYSMSTQIRKERKMYYEMLEKTQRGTLDITNWINWFLKCLGSSLNATEETLGTVLAKARFWEKHKNTELNDRQKLMMNKLFGGFFGSLTSTKWAKMTKCSADTALRDIQFLMDKKILKKENAGGRSTTYILRSIEPKKS